MAVSLEGQQALGPSVTGRLELRASRGSQIRAVAGGGGQGEAETGQEGEWPA